MKQGILKMRVDITCLADTIGQIVHLARQQRGAYVCVSNVHMCMATFDSADFANIVNQADLVLPDGKPMSWAQQLLGHPSASQVRGEDIMSALCQLSGKQQLRIGFYGGACDEVLQRVETRLRQRFNDMTISYRYAPPFRALTESEDQAVISAINNAGVDILFVGIGCPKQERWMAEHKQHLSCVMLGVGAAFDFIAGDKQSAPRWLRRLGMEWFFRLCCEPRRLWRRYLDTNPRFVWYFLQQWLLKRQF